MTQIFMTFPWQHGEARALMCGLSKFLQNEPVLTQAVL